VTAALVALGLTLGAPPAQPAAATARAAAYVACELTPAAQDPPGGTPAYNLAVQRRGTTCAVAKQVMVAFHRCRTTTGSRCARRVLSAWRCIGRRDAGTPTFRGTFTCRAPGRRVRGSYQQDTPSCFGAAARDPELRCFSATRAVFPALGQSDPDMGWVCDPGVVAGACVSGVPPARARAHVALVGDSHTYHWRSALTVVTDAERWRLYTLSTGGCFFSDAVKRFSPGCADWYEGVQGWFRQHPEVHTVFVTSNADTPVAVGAGETLRDVKIEGFRRAWQRLPRTVRHIVVLRDLTNSTQGTFDCVTRAVQAGTQRLAPLCSQPRAKVLREDVGVVAARRLRAERYGSIDLSSFQCSRTRCFPVVGGVMVNGDIYGHLNPSFMRTLGPYLLREVRRLRASW
jgi:hypothetical protein